MTNTIAIALISIWSYTNTSVEHFSSTTLGPDTKVVTTEVIQVRDISVDECQCSLTNLLSRKTEIYRREWVKQPVNEAPSYHSGSNIFFNLPNVATNNFIYLTNVPVMGGYETNHVR